MAAGLIYGWGTAGEFPEAFAPGTPEPSATVAQPSRLRVLAASRRQFGKRAPGRCPNPQAGRLRYLVQRDTRPTGWQDRQLYFQRSDLGGLGRTLPAAA